MKRKRSQITRLITIYRETPVNKKFVSFLPDGQADIG